MMPIGFELRTAPGVADCSGAWFSSGARQSLLAAYVKTKGKRACPVCGTALGDDNDL
jgi:hypothetical protein